MVIVPLSIVTGMHLLIAQEVADETDTELDIRNIGVLMFMEHPEKLIPGAYIELIRFNTKEQKNW